MNLRICALLGAVLLCMAAHAAAAGYRTSLATTPSSGISAEISSPLERAPRTNNIPFWVAISNHSGAARTWDIQCVAGNASGRGQGESVSSQQLSVANGETARLAVLVPVEPAGTNNSYYRQNSVRVTGFGIESGNGSLSASGYSSKPPTPFIGMGETLSVPVWESLKRELDTSGYDLLGSPVEVSLLGTDWRGLTCFDCLWLTDAEYAGLDAPRRQAIRHWIDQGGILCLCTQELDPALRASLGLKETGDTAMPGLGFVRLIPWDGKSLDVEFAKTWVRAVKPLKENLDLTDAQGWKMTNSVGAIPLNAPFLISFIVLFAIFVGPVNLFRFAGAHRRHRLFWTTPLISLIASLLLILVIIMQDGFGGSGERMMLQFLFPDQKKAVVFQEQVARTGVLLSHGFDIGEDVILSPLNAGRVVTSGFDQKGRSYSGDWFASRSVQAQRAEAIIPSRAGIQLLNADAAGKGAAPIVVSSIPASLDKIYYTDSENRHWVGDRLRTGEKITLRENRFFQIPKMEGSVYAAKLGERIISQPGTFVALSDNGPFLDTLRSIRWRKQQAAFFGPVTTAP